MGTPSQTPIQIFRRGRQVASDGTAVDWTDAMLAAAAAAYDPEVHQAPLVVGHPQAPDPAWGWVRGLNYDQGTGILCADPDQVDDAFADLVNAGRLKYVSASWWPPGSPHNPKPGTFYLKHLGFLGAQPPAVKGLRPVEFAEFDDDQFLTFSEPVPAEPVPDEAGATATDTTAPVGSAARTDTLEAPSMSDADIAAREADLAQRTQDLTAREQAIAQREAAAAAQAAALHHAECLAYCEGLASQGRLLPPDQAPLAALLASLPTQPEAASLDYAEPTDSGAPQARTPAAYLRDLLARLPVQVDYAERSAPRGERAPGAAFIAPPGYQVSAADADLHGRAAAYAAQHGCDLITAAKAVGAQ